MVPHLTQLAPAVPPYPGYVIIYKEVSLDKIFTSISVLGYFEVQNLGQTPELGLYCSVWIIDDGDEYCPLAQLPTVEKCVPNLKRLNFTHFGTVQFMGGWHRHFTSLDAKNFTDMIKIVGLCSSSLSKSPGPWPT